MMHKRWALRQLLACLALLSCLAAMGCVQATTATRPPVEGRIVILTDVHFNPFRDERIVPELMNSGYDDWHRIFSKSSTDAPSALGEETNYALLSSALERSSKVCPSPDFILFTGDVLAHDFQAKFDVYSKSESEYRAFVVKTLQFVGSEISRRFPHTAIYFTLGNNDTFNGDYNIPPDGAFLQSTSDMFYRAWLKGDSADQPSFTQTFVRGGDYTAEPDHSSRFTIISLNNIYFSPKSPYHQDGWLQIGWLEEQLRAAQKSGRKVWLLMHIPPGVDTYSTLHRPGSVVPFWDESTRNSEGQTYLQAFDRLMQRYAPVIMGVFSGHTHMDHFRLVLGGAEDAAPAAWVHVTPAVSPQFGNNAAFEVLRYDRESFTIEDYAANYYDQRSAEWEQEYDFHETYLQTAITPAALWRVQEGLNRNTAWRSQYIRFYDASNPDGAPIDERNWRAYWCGITRLAPAEFSACYP